MRARPPWTRARRCWPPREQKLPARVAELTGAAAQAGGLEAARQSHDDANWHGLVKLYESMKPRDAAAIFNDLDHAGAAAGAGPDEGRKAAPILAAMQPGRAAR